MAGVGVRMFSLLVIPYESKLLMVSLLLHIKYMWYASSMTMS